MVHRSVMRRSRFLPVFFTLLSIAFVIALVLRLRSDMRQQTIASANSPSPPVKAETAAISKEEAQTTSTSVVRRASGRTAPSVAAEEGLKSSPHEAIASHSRRQGQSPPQTQPQSLIERVIAPIVKVFSANKPQQPSTSPLAPQQSASTSQSHAASASTAGPDKQDPKDPNSDSTPPQLLGVEFSPPEVQDGQDAAVIITATDDLSGIRGISGTISSPTGKALQGFATQHDGDTNRYIGHVTIAKNAEQGIWKVSFINMSDNASNSVTLSYAQGTVPPGAVLRVTSSNSDNTPPVLKNVWADKRAVQGGEKDIIFVQADDDKSGVNLVSAVFQSPSKLARVGAGCQHMGDGDTWQCELNVPTCIDCGDWQLEQVTLQDKANNLATYRQDNPLVAATKINISGASCDNTPPTLQSLVLDTNDVVLGDKGAIVTITIAASDDNCGVAGVSGQYVGPGPGSGGFFPLQQAGDSSTWTGQIHLDPRSAKGVWRINSIQLSDKGHNLRVYYATDPLLAPGVFHVR